MFVCLPSDTIRRRRTSVLRTGTAVRRVQAPNGLSATTTGDTAAYAAYAAYARALRVR